MKTVKLLTSLSLTLGIIMSSSIPAFAADSNLPTTNPNTEVYGSASLDDSSTIVSGPLTFDQIVNEISKDHNISREKAITQIESNFANSRSLKSRSISSAALSARAATYHTVSSTVTVNTVYKPTIKFYCKTDTWPGSSFRAIDKILDISLNRSYNGMSKQFGGTIYAHLETSNRIYWRLEGDFYNNGTTTYNGKVDIGLGDDSSISFGVSHSKNHYAYAYKTGYARF